jgi:hypothetical protein
MLLEILRSLEGLATEVTLMWLQRNMDSHVGSDVVSLHCGSSASTPLAGEIEVVGRLATDMALTYVILRNGISTI